MKYELVCIDLDGTLLNSSEEISAFNKEMIRQAKAKGIKVAIVTGRSYHTASRYAEQIGLDSPLICFNGGMIVDPDTCEVLHRTGIGQDYARRVLRIWQDAGCTAFVSRASVGKPSVYISNLGDHQGVLDHRSKYGDAAEICETLVDDLWFNPIQMLTLGKTDRVRNCREYEKLAADESIIWLQDSNGSQTPYLIVYSREARKSFGLQWLSDYYGIPREKVVAIGDYLNDVDMLEWAGCAVAMGNAVPEVKAVADYITDDHNEDGVGKALRKLLLQ